ncbi:MAG: hypothetical protein ACR2RA_02440 [Geminicoccaceae bacterium]
MTRVEPFPFKDLADGRSSADRSKADSEKLGQKAGPSADRLEGMAFTPFGPDPETASEPERLYTAEDLAKAVDKARGEAARETETELRCALADDLEHRRVDVTSAIRDQLDRHRSAFDDELGHMAEVSRKLALALGEALIPRALESRPLVDISDALRTTLARLANEPSIELRLPPDLIESGGALFADIAQETGFAGAITTVADASLGRGDAELRWSGGAVERRMERLQVEARGLVERWLPGVPETDEQPDDAPASSSTGPQIPIVPNAAEPDAGTEQERALP